MSTQETHSRDERRKPPPSLEVRVAAARAAVTASKKTGRPVAPRVQELAELELASVGIGAAAESLTE